MANDRLEPWRVTMRQMLPAAGHTAMTDRIGYGRERGRGCPPLPDDED
jgi:hypothetical protein